jgi:hypothetical protein
MNLFSRIIDRLTIRPAEYTHGLTNNDLNKLARYNSEVARGIAHTKEWDEKMATLQEVYNANVQLKSTPPHPLPFRIEAE